MESFLLEPDSRSVSKHVLELLVISVPLLMGRVLPYAFAEVKVCLSVVSPQQLEMLLLSNRKKKSSLFHNVGIMFLL